MTKTNRRKIGMLGVMALIYFFATSYLEAKESVYSFSTAKKKLYRTVYQNSGETFYCGCSFNKKKVNLSSCGLGDFFPKKQRSRANRIEAEHLISASALLKKNGKWRQCVIDAKSKKESARSYCQKKDLDYRKAHNDQVNLVASVGQINANRSNKPFVERVKKGTKGYSGYGRCDIEIDSRGIIPPKDKRGDIARVAFYMHGKYGVNYSKRQASLFHKWSAQDPISNEERARNKLVMKSQGYGLKL